MTYSGRVDKGGPWADGENVFGSKEHVEAAVEAAENGDDFEKEPPLLIEAVIADLPAFRALMKMRLREWIKSKVDDLFEPPPPRGWEQQDNLGTVYASRSQRVDARPEPFVTVPVSMVRGSAFPSVVRWASVGDDDVTGSPLIPECTGCAEFIEPGSKRAYRCALYPSGWRCGECEAKAEVPRAPATPAYRPAVGSAVIDMIEDRIVRVMGYGSAARMHDADPRVGVRVFHGGPGDGSAESDEYVEVRRPDQSVVRLPLSCICALTDKDHLGLASTGLWSPDELDSELAKGQTDVVNADPRIED